jgi:hypothetical protein
MPDTVIDRVNTLGSAEPEILSFEDRHGRKIGDIDVPAADPDELTGVDDGLDTVLDPQELLTGVVPDDGHPAVDEFADVPTDVTCYRMAPANPWILVHAMGAATTDLQGIQC